MSTFEEGGVSIAVLDTGKLLLTAAGTYQPRPVIGYELHILGLDDSAAQEWMVDVRGGTSLGASGHAIVTPSRFFVPTVQRADIAGVDFGFLLYVYGFDLEGRLDWENRYGQFTLRPYASALMNDMLYLAGVEQISRFEERQFVLAISVEDGTEQWIRTPDFEQEGTWIGDLVGCATENLLYGVAAKRHSFSTTEHFLFSVDSEGMLLKQASLGILDGSSMVTLSFVLLDSLTARLVIVYDEFVDGKREEHFVLMTLDLDGNILSSIDGMLAEPSGTATSTTDLKSHAAVVDSEGNVTIAGERIEQTAALFPFLGSSFRSRGFMVQIDPEGVVRWFTELAHPLNALVETPEGDFVATGSSSDFLKTVLIRVSADGRVLPFGL